MPSLVKNIIPRKYAENAQTTQYTASNCKALIDTFTVTNISAGNVTFSCNLPAYGQSADNSNLVMAPRTIFPGKTDPCPELVGQSLENLGYISTLAGAASALVISATGREIT